MVLPGKTIMEMMRLMAIIKKQQQAKIKRMKFKYLQNTFNMINGNVHQVDKKNPIKHSILMTFMKEGQIHFTFSNNSLGLHQDIKIPPRIQVLTFLQMTLQHLILRMTIQIIPKVHIMRCSSISNQIIIWKYCSLVKT